MKIKIALLSASALSLILVLLGGFIYFTVYSRVLQLQTADVTNQAEAIAEYSVSHVGDYLDTHDAQQWLRQYVRRGQEVVLVGPNRQVIASLGDMNERTLLGYFRPSQATVQETLSAGRHQTIIYTSLPIKSEDKSTLYGYVIMASYTDEVDEYMESLFKVLVGGAVGAVVLAALVGYFIAAAGLRPVNQLIRVVERIEANRLNERVTEPKGRDEVARLTVTFNRMLSRIQRSFKQQMSFVADASHEIRTPLTTISGYANLLHRWGKTDPEVLDKAIQVIQKESQRLTKLADDLLLLAGVEANDGVPAGTAPVDAVLADVVDELVMLHPNVSLQKELHADSSALITPNHLRQIAMNLLSNALKYTEEGGFIVVRTWRKNGSVWLQIADTGCGIPNEDLPHVFDRFYRVDKSRERERGGSGLGLAIVKELIESYRGSITVESQLGEGTSFTIRLMASQSG